MFDVHFWVSFMRAPPLAAEAASLIGKEASLKFHRRKQRQDIRFSFLNAEPLNTRITSGVETMINIDSKLKGISNMFGQVYVDIYPLQ